MLSQKLRRAARKIQKANRGKWGTLSTGEKVLKVVLTLIRLAIIVSLGMVVFTIGLAIWVAVGIMQGFTGAVDQEVNRAYDRWNRPRYY